MSLLDVVLMAFPALMAYAAASDLLTMTIPNRITIALAVLFFLLAPIAGLGWEQIGWHAAVGAGALVIGIAVFAFGWMGGGDAKLMAATALWFGPTMALVNYFVCFAIVGGGLGLALLTFRRWPLPAFALGWGWLARLHEKSTGVPYGIALAAGALAFYTESPIWMAHLGQ
ncbi:A24 family peptidase [Alsobacter sp. R-9]